MDVLFVFWTTFMAALGAILGSFINMFAYRYPLMRAARLEGTTAPKCSARPSVDAAHSGSREPGLTANVQSTGGADKLVRSRDGRCASSGCHANTETFSLAWPASHCPKCQASLKWWHNLPIVSYLALGGRCGFCKAPIPHRYLVTELVGAGLGALTFATLAPLAGTASAAAAAILSCFLLAMAVIEQEQKQVFSELAVWFFASCAALVTAPWLLSALSAWEPVASIAGTSYFPNLPAWPSTSQGWMNLLASASAALVGINLLPKLYPKTDEATDSRESVGLVAAGLGLLCGPQGTAVMLLGASAWMGAALMFQDVRKARHASKSVVDSARAELGSDSMRTAELSASSLPNRLAKLRSSKVPTSDRTSYMGFELPAEPQEASAQSTAHSPNTPQPTTALLASSILVLVLLAIS